MTIIEQRTMTIVCAALPQIAAALKRIANALDEEEGEESDEDDPS